MDLLEVVQGEVKATAREVRARLGALARENDRLRNVWLEKRTHLEHLLKHPSPSEDFLDDSEEDADDWERFVHPEALKMQKSHEARK